MKAQYYVSECPDTKRQFLVESGKDGNIIELTSDNVSAMGLVPFLVEQWKYCQKYILSLVPNLYADDDYEKFDAAKDEFFDDGK